MLKARRYNTWVRLVESECIQWRNESSLKKSVVIILQIQYMTWMWRQLRHPVLVWFASRLSVSSPWMESYTWLRHNMRVCLAVRRRLVAVGHAVEEPVQVVEARPLHGLAAPALVHQVVEFAAAARRGCGRHARLTAPRTPFTCVSYDLRVKHTV